MKVFRIKELWAANEYAQGGGQALHLMPPTVVPGRTEPTPFAHLFDGNRKRLIRTAMICGVRHVKIDREDLHGQHVDLWGKPLDAALEIARKEAL